MVNHEKRESKSPILAGNNRGAESRAMQIPSRGQKQFKTTKVKFLAVEEAIKLNSRDQNTKGVTDKNAKGVSDKNARVRIVHRSSQPGLSQPLPAIPERTSNMDKVASSKCVPMEEDDKIRSSTNFVKKMHLSNDGNHRSESPCNDSTSGRSTKRVQWADRPAILAAPAINSKPSTSTIMSKKDMKSCGTELPSEQKEIKSKGFRPEKEANSDLEKKVHLSNGENHSIELPSNDSTSGRSTKKVQLEDRPARFAASVINSKPSTSMIMSKEGTESCSAEVRSQQEAKLDSEKKVQQSNGEKDSLELPPSDSTSGRTTKEEILARLVASVIKSKPSTNTAISQKDMKSCRTELPSEMKETITPEKKARLALNFEEGELTPEMEDIIRPEIELPSETEQIIRPEKRAMMDSNREEGELPSEVKEIGRPEKKAMLDSNREGTSSEIMEHTSPITSSLQNNSPNESELGITWNGSFVILDGHKIYEGFFARPPGNVCPKASDFSKQMAQVLQFKVCPRSDRWPKIFQIDAPDENDIALYFYPGHFERSKENYISLLMMMEEYDMVIKSRMGDVELIVFPSKWLPTDSQTFEGSHFMWGAFRTLKDRK